MDDRPRSGINVWRIIGWLIAILSLGFILRWMFLLDRSVWRSVLQLKPWWLIGSLIVFQFWFVSRYMAWEWIVRRHGSEGQRHETLRTWTISELMRYVPGNIWSFAARYRGIVAQGTTGTNAVQAMVIEAFALVSGAGVTGVLFLNPAHWWWAGLLAATLIPSLAPVVLRWVTRLFKWSSAPEMEFAEALRLFLWYVVVWVIFGLATTMIYWSFSAVPGLSISFLIGVNVVAWFIGYISIVTPMGLGVREVSFVKLTAGSLVAAVASLVALVTRLWLVLSELVFLALVIFWSNRKRT